MDREGMLRHVDEGQISATPVAAPIGEAQRWQEENQGLEKFRQFMAIASLICITVFSFMLGARLDCQDVECRVPWGNVFTSLFVALSINVFMHLVRNLHPKYIESAKIASKMTESMGMVHTNQKAVNFFVLLASVGQLVFVILIYLKIVGSLDVPFIVVFIPLFVASPLQIISYIYQMILLRGEINSRQEGDNVRSMSQKQMGLAMLVLVFNGMGVLLTILVALKLDNIVTSAWEIVLLPIWLIPLPFAILFAVMSSVFIRGHAIGLLLAGVCGSICVVGVGMAPVYVFLGLLVAKLNGATLAWMSVFIPMYIILCLGSFGGFCGICAMICGNSPAPNQGDGPFAGFTIHANAVDQGDDVEQGQ